MYGIIFNNITHFKHRMLTPRHSKMNTSLDAHDNTLALCYLQKTNQH